MAGLWPGAAALAALLILIGGAFVALLSSAGELDPAALLADRYLRHVVLFTLGQAGASTLLSLAAALPVARALARRSAFPGRTMLLRLFGLPLVMPTLVAILGLATVFGETGWLNRLGQAAAMEPLHFLYGLSGILIAHVFFNLPLAVRLLLPAWQSVPTETWRLAAQLGMRSRHLFRVIEWPLLRQVLPGIAGVIFMLCFTSFAVVLTLGGGPRAATLEVAIYQALRLDFDIARAVALALMQVALCGLVLILLRAWGREVPLSASFDRPAPRPDLGPWLGRAGDGAAILGAVVFIGLPLAAVVSAAVAGSPGTVLIEERLWQAALRSIAVAGVAAAVAMALGIGILSAQRELRLRRGRPRAAAMLELSGSLIMVVPPLVLGVGLFVLLSRVADVLALGLGLVVIVNAVMGLPYVLRIVGPSMERTVGRYERLCLGLGIRGWNRLRLVEWPASRPAVGLAAALVAALAAGDLGAIALFGTEDNETLALLLYRLIAAYRMEAAATVAGVLLALSLGLFVVIERGVGRRGQA